MAAPLKEGAEHTIINRTRMTCIGRNIKGCRHFAAVAFCEFLDLDIFTPVDIAASIRGCGVLLFDQFKTPLIPQS
jgi:hypothetical protein